MSCLATPLRSTIRAIKPCVNTNAIWPCSPVGRAFLDVAATSSRFPKVTIDFSPLLPQCPYIIGVPDSYTAMSSCGRCLTTTHSVSAIDSTAPTHVGDDDWTPPFTPSGLVLCQLSALAPARGPIGGERLRDEAF